MFVIKLLIMAGLVIYAGYFRGWNGWSLAPLGVLLAIIFLVEGVFDVPVDQLSGWITKPIDIFILWLPLVTMAIYGKEGREKLTNYAKDVWAWVQTKRQL
jgi:hypothetical protein